MMMPMIPDELQQQIRDAWANFPPPDSEAIVPTTPVPGTGVIARWGDYGDCHSIFAGKRWDEFDYGGMMHARCCVSFLTPDALRYFLPAFLLASIYENVYFDFGWDVTEESLRAIRGCVARSNTDQFGLSEAQLRAVQGYLDWLAGLDLADTAHEHVLACNAYFQTNWRRDPS